MSSGALISAIQPGSKAEAAGLVIGDTILRVNGQKLQDLIDLSFALSEERVELEVKKHSGEIVRLRIRKKLDEALGFEFESAVFDRVRTCANKCLFCFVDQMPEGLRETLYVKDDDYRLSFLYGNFVTLTNLTVVDDREGAIGCPATQLPPYAAMTCVRVGLASTLGVYTNTAMVTGAPPVGPVVTSSNRSHYEVPYVLASKTAVPGTGAIVRTGDLITYTVWVTAVSSVPLVNIPITDSIPAGTSYAPGSAVPAPTSGPNPLVWVLATMQPGIPYSVSFTVIVLGANEAGGILNVAWVGNNPVTPTNEIVHFFAPTAIELTSFTASRDIGAGGGPVVTVRWGVANEANTLGYQVFRAETNNRAAAVLMTGGVIAASGTGGNYAWVDAAAATDRTYFYWLQEIELDGRTVTEYGPVNVGPLSAPQLRLYLPAIRR